MVFPYTLHPTPYTLDGVARMELTLQERESQTLTAETLKTAVQLVQTNGYVVFEKVLPAELASGEA